MWIFGDVWCKVWLASDVLLWVLSKQFYYLNVNWNPIFFRFPCSCTASILNLCAISLDRYVAVTRPVTYPSIMSTRRAKSLIAGLWVLSFVICFPPLIGWKDDNVSAHRISLKFKMNFWSWELLKQKLNFPFPRPARLELKYQHERN